MNDYKISKCDYILNGKDEECKKNHILNPSTGICVDKNSILGKHLNKSENQEKKIRNEFNYHDVIENFKSLKLEMLSAFKQIEINQENLKYVLQELKDEIKEEIYEIKNILFEVKENKNKNVTEEIETLEKNVEKCNEEIFDIKSSIENLNILDEKLQVSKSSEEQRIIEILKNDYNIISSSNREHPINLKIKNFLIFVRSNIEKGKKTIMTDELIKHYF